MIEKFSKMLEKTHNNIERKKRALSLKYGRELVKTMSPQKT